MAKLLIIKREIKIDNDCVHKLLKMKGWGRDEKNKKVRKELRRDTKESIV